MMTAPCIRNQKLGIRAAINKNGDMFTVKQKMPFNTNSLNDLMIDVLLYAEEKGYYSCVFCMDNVLFHKSQDVRITVGTRGHETVLLPP